MGRRKRSERVAGPEVPPKPAPREIPKTAERTLAAICPVCGKTVPMERAIKEGYVTLGKVPYFESIEWDSQKPFGVSYPAGGRGSFREWEYINPEDAPEFFEAVRQRFIQALREWVKKGWIGQEDI